MMTLNNSFLFFRGFVLYICINFVVWYFEINFAHKSHQCPCILPGIHFPNHCTYFWTFHALVSKPTPWCPTTENNFCLIYNIEVHDYNTYCFRASSSKIPVVKNFSMMNFKVLRCVYFYCRCLNRALVFDLESSVYVCYIMEIWYSKIGIKWFFIMFFLYGSWKWLKLKTQRNFITLKLIIMLFLDLQNIIFLSVSSTSTIKKHNE